MKLQADRFDTLSVQAHGPGWVVVGNQRYAHSVVVGSNGMLQPWPCSCIEDLQASHFETLLAFEPEVVVFGSGERLQFVHPQVLRPLIDAGIGVETMDSMAAARTFNILAGEGRRVAAAILLGPPKPAS